MKRSRSLSSRIRFDYSVLRLGRKLTDQQLWCLGADVRTDRSLLEELGLHYHSRPRKDAGCSRLTGRLPGGGDLSIWGFGFIASDCPHGALWLDRRNFRPCLLRDWDRQRVLWDLHELPPARAPQTDGEADAALFLLIQLCERMAEYERAVLDVAGLDARNRIVAQWKFHKSAIFPEDVPSSWLRIACSARDLRDALRPVAEAEAA